MRSRLIPVLGWVEAVVGLLLLAVSILGFAQDGEPLGVFLFDVFTFVLLLVTVRFPRAGLAALILSGFAGLVLDPQGDGMSHYIAACGVILAVRLGRYPLAVVGTATLGAPLFLTMYSRSSGQILSSFVASVLIYLVVWALGLGTRSVGKAEASRVEARHRARQLAVATDLHDFVARNLSALVLAAEALPYDDPAIDDVVERARLANASLRAITAVLREEGETATSIGAADALAQGTEEITEHGGRAQLAPGTTSALTGLPDVLDRATGRILAEALHNAATHADLDEPVVVAAERADDRLDLVVSNRVGDGEHPSDDAMGLTTVRQHAEVVGGRAESAAHGDVWVCTASLPLSHPGRTR
ncbi:MAG: hypothetical protein QM713_05920 [Arachnia sp.]